MAVTITKPEINLREKLKELDFETVPFQKMPSGSVIQVVNSELTEANITTTSTNYQPTGLEASITPIKESSNILILITLQGVTKNNTDTLGAVGIALFKNDSLYKEIDTLASFNEDSTKNSIGGVSGSFLDKPYEMNQITYRGKFKSMNGGSAQVNSRYNPGDISTSTITLMEIAG